MRSITDQQKHQFLDDGFIVVKNAVPEAVVARARSLIADSLPKNERRLLVPGELATHPSVIGPETPRGTLANMQAHAQPGLKATQTNAPKLVWSISF